MKKNFFKNIFTKKEDGLSKEIKPVNNFTDFTLMYKDEPIAKFFANDNKIILEEIYNHQFFPVNSKNYENDPATTTSYFKSWMGKRCIPNARTNAGAMLNAIKINNTFELSRKSFGVSLNDQYWYKPDNVNVSWNEISPYRNKYSRKIGDTLLNPDVDNNDIDLVSPDTTTQGVDAKRWIQDDNNISYLIKTNINCEQVACNEVLAFEICKRLGINATEYSLERGNVLVSTYDGRKENRNCLFAKVKNFCDENHRFIPAHVYKADCLCITEKEFIHNVLLDDDFRPDIIKMVVLDFLITNEDRHYNNFGFLVDELGNVKVAPIYDSGNSMYYDSDIRQIGMQEKYSSITPTFKEALELCFVKKDDYDWYDSSKLNRISAIYRDILNESDTPEVKINALCNFLEKRIKDLDAIIKNLKESYVDLDVVINDASDLNSDNAENDQGYKIVNGKVLLTTVEAQRECKRLLETKQIRSISQYPAYINTKRDRL